MAKRKKKRISKKVSKKRLRWFRRKDRQPILPEAIRPWVVGILMLLIAVFTLLSFFNLAGVAGEAFLNFSEFLTGKAIFLIPLLFVLGGLSFFGPKEKSGWSIFWAILLLCLGICGSLAALEFSRIENLSFKLFYSGRGGWLGNLVAWPLFRMLDFWVTLVIFLVMILISGLIFWHFLYLPKKRKEILRPEEGTVEELIKKPLIKKVFAPKFQVSKIEDKIKKEKIEEKTEKPTSPVLEAEVNLLAKNHKERSGWNLPSLDLLALDKGTPQAGDIKINAEIIDKTLENFGIEVKMSEINIGPTVTQYTFKPAEGVKLSKITALNNNLALGLAAHPLRIEAPIPGKSLVGVEVPNKTRTLVRLRNILSAPEFQNEESNLVFSIGRDVVGKPFCADLARMPHLIVAGSTGSGKTICLSGIILSLLYRNSPKRLKFILIDPKRVEFTNYGTLPHVLGPVIFDAQKTLSVLKWLIEEMERRFKTLSVNGVRNIHEFNQKIEKNNKDNEEEIMPYIVLVIDELADLMAAKGRDIETGIVKLAQKARAVGIHLILATQRPSVEVITGLIKANVISRIAFQVASQVDSRTILDTSGAEKLLGLGDLLFISAEFSKPKRLQGNYVSGKEIEKVVDFINKQNHKEEDALTQSLNAELEKVEKIVSGSGATSTEVDPVYQEAKELVLETKKASASFLQRKLRVGYARAARLLDTLEERGVVGPPDGAKPREVFFDEDAMIEESMSQQVGEEDINDD
ncbi:MAG: DNA translocase FtsK 4TM domain-containing protein [Patescibacteria group bacterium]|nr:DNA translocase FtsK 4TM domain-containing protein [Patescibacteria group bacterium]